MLVLFLDTNIFLQCKKLAEIDWTEGFPSCGEILLVIPHSTIEEIDEFKNQGNSRRARRAREANSLFRQMMNSAQSSVRIAGGNVRIDCQFGDGNAFKGIAELGTDKPDERLILEALQWKSEHSTDEVVVLTDDTIPLLLARRHGMNARQPPEAWKLAPEPDESERRLQSLEGEVSKLRGQQQPTFEVSFQIDSTETSGPIGRSIPTPRSLLEEEKVDLANEFFKAFPCKTDFSDIPIAWLAGAVTETVTHAEVAKYTKETYPKWQERVRKIIANFSAVWFRPERLIELTIAVKNNGLVTANDVVVEISAQGCLIGCPSNHQDGETLVSHLKSSAKFPRPPKPPQPRIHSPFDQIAFPQPYIPDSLLRTSSRLRPKDEFFLKSGKFDELSHSIAFECEAFSQHAKPEIFEICVIMDSGVAGARVDVAVAAANTWSPTSRSIVFKIERILADPVALIRSEIARMSKG